ncbi:HET-domain-containing protein, partial [Cryphonectria parasitica EP155]
MHWLEACSKSHPDCCSSTMAGEPPWYPTRLLDVGEHGQKTGGGEKIRLVTTASERPRGGYTTLSHCWGTSQPLRLLTGTMASFQQSINLAALPQTFRDAIEVTRRIGIRYLWIDSLCIIQDDDGNTDWLREAAMMHKVYSRSFCTISATASQDCNDGIFRTRTAPVVPEDPVPFDTQHITCDVAESQFWDDNVSNAHINTRGWVFQERLLSPRTIHFGEQQVFWECRGLDAAESFPAGWPRDPSYQFKDRLPNELDAARQHRGPEWEVFWYSRWGHVVYEYSRTDLTVPSDKLVALGGVANTFAAANGDQYVAGMWRRHLAVEILWLASRDRSGAQVAVRPPQYRAPSWSWASIDGEV